MSQVSILLCQFDIRMCGSENLMRRDAEPGSENSGKIAQIAVAHCKGRFCDVMLSRAQKNFGQVEAMVAQVIQGGMAVYLFKTPVELASAHSCSFGKGCDIRRINGVLAQTPGSMAYPFNVIRRNLLLPDIRTGPGPDLFQLVDQKFQGLAFQKQGPGFPGVRAGQNLIYGLVHLGQDCVVISKRDLVLESL